MAATGASQRNGAAAHEMPRFAGGMVNLRGPIRMTAEAVIDEAMGAQAEDARDGNVRNGRRERALVAGVGRLAPRIPKLRRGTCFPEDLPARYSRTDRAVMAAAAEMVANGVSTRKAEKEAHSPGVDYGDGGAAAHAARMMAFVAFDGPFLRKAARRRWRMRPDSG